jgi:hypothetical protein
LILSDGTLLAIKFPSAISRGVFISDATAKTALKCFYCMRIQ